MRGAKDGGGGEKWVYSVLLVEIVLGWLRSRIGTAPGQSIRQKNHGQRENKQNRDPAAVLLYNNWT